MEWYPFYPALYRADTMHLTAEQDGIYRRLIDHYMETRQPLPDNDHALARAAAVTIELWLTHAAVIRAFFTPYKSGKLHHKRCDIELERQDGHNRKQSEKGKLGALKRWKISETNQEANSHGNARAIATPMPNDSRGEERRGEERILEDKTLDASGADALVCKEDENGKKTPRAKAVRYDIERVINQELPDWLPKPTWELWVRYRAEIKKPIPEARAGLVIRNMEKYHDDGISIPEMVEHSIAGSFQGLYPPPKRAEKAKTFDKPFQPKARNQVC